MPTSMFLEACAWGALIAATTERAAAANKASFLDTQGLRAQRFQDASQPLLERDLRLPTQQLAGASDVRLANVGVVFWKRLEDDLAGGPRHPEHDLGELEQRVLARVAEIHGQMLAARGQQIEPAHEVVDVTEAAGLRAVAEDGQRLAGQRLAEKGRNRSPV